MFNKWFSDIKDTIQEVETVGDCFWLLVLVLCLVICSPICIIDAIASIRIRKRGD